LRHSAGRFLPGDHQRDVTQDGGRRAQQRNVIGSPSNITPPIAAMTGTLNCTVAAPVTRVREIT